MHHTHDEGFLLLEGEVSLFLPGREVALRPGEYVLAPRGIPHTYQVGKAPARWINVSTPAGFEQSVKDVAALDEATPKVLGARPLFAASTSSVLLERCRNSSVWRAQRVGGGGSPLLK